MAGRELSERSSRIGVRGSSSPRTRGFIEDVTARAEAASCHKVQFKSNKGRGEAHAFYRSLGFEPSAVGFRLYLDGR